MSDDVYKLEPVVIDGLICNFYEDPNIQCIVVEDGVRCNHGVKIKSRQLCTKHYAQMQRSGQAIRMRMSNNERSEVEMLKLLEQGLSTMCLCAHGYLEHDHELKLSRRCKIPGCLCKHFNSIDPITLHKVKIKMNKLGVLPLNNGVICLHCDTHVEVGYWHDGHVFRRIREHLKIHQVRRCELPAYRRTG